MPPAAGSSRSRRSPASPATAARPTTRRRKAGVIGLVAALAPGARRARHHVNAVAPGFIETAMTATMPIDAARGRPPDEQPGPGRPAGRRRRDDRLARLARLRRRHRQRRPGLRPEPAGGVMASCRRAAPVPATRPLYRQGACRGAAGDRRRGAAPDLPDTRAACVGARPTSTGRTWPPTTGCAGSGWPTRCRRRTRTCSRFPLAMRLMSAADVPVPGDRPGARRQPDHRAPADRGSASGSTSRVRAERPAPARPRSPVRRGRDGDGGRRRGVARRLDVPAAGAQGGRRRAARPARDAPGARRPPPRTGGSSRRHRAPLRRGLRRPQPDPHLAARRTAFGFRRPIAHGMWTKARCLAALEGRLPERVHGRRARSSCRSRCRHGRLAGATRTADIARRRDVGPAAPHRTVAPA